MRQFYTLEDELDWVAWIASNGLTDRDGLLKTDAEIEIHGLPKTRSCNERMQFLLDYANGWKYRAVPTGWEDIYRKKVIDYIRGVAIPTLEAMRQLQLGDVV